jgi:hypothetical protein
MISECEERKLIPGAQVLDELAVFWDSTARDVFNLVELQAADLLELLADGGSQLMAGRPGSSFSAPPLQCEHMITVILAVRPESGIWAISGKELITCSACLVTTNMPRTLTASLERPTIRADGGMEVRPQEQGSVIR